MGIPEEKHITGEILCSIGVLLISLASIFVRGFRENQFQGILKFVANYNISTICY